MKISEPKQFHDLSHYCFYFQSDSSNNEPPKCFHTELEAKKSINQKTCLYCDHKKAVEDSLNYMAFNSPVKTNNPIIDLKFDSPTTFEIVETVENNIIDDTLTEDQLETTVMIVDENQSTFDKSCRDSSLADDESDSSDDLDSMVSFKSAKSSQSFNSSKHSLSMSMSESLVWSNSDEEDGTTQTSIIHSNERVLGQEKKEESKRKNAIEIDEDHVLKNENDLFLYKNRNNFNYLNKRLNSDEHWYCPRFDPPLPSDLNEISNQINAPIIQYYKTNKKFKVVNH